MNAAKKKIKIDDFIFRDFQYQKTSDHLTVICFVDSALTPDGKMNKQEAQKVLDLVKQMGQWESLEVPRAGRGSASRRAQHYGYDKYTVGSLLCDGLYIPEGVSQQTSLRFTLEKEEALRRTEGKNIYCSLELSEIKDQIENIKKWKRRVRQESAKEEAKKKEN